MRAVTLVLFTASQAALLQGVLARGGAGLGTLALALFVLATDACLLMLFLRGSRLERDGSAYGSAEAQYGGGAQAARRAAEALEGRARLLLEAVPHATFVCDEAGSIVQWSESAEALFGWRTSEIVGQNVAAVLPSARHSPGIPPGSPRRQNSEAVLPLGPTDDDGRARDMPAVRADGRQLVAAVSTARATVNGESIVTYAVRDRTVRRAAEDTSRAFMALTRDAIVGIDADSRIVIYGGAADTMFGWTAPEIVGQPLSLLMPPPFSEIHDRLVERFVRTGARRFRDIVEVSAKRRDGSVFPVEIGVSRTMIGGIEILVGVMRDITKRKDGERLLALERRRNEQLTAALVPAAVARSLHGGEEPAAGVRRYADASVMLVRVCGLEEAGPEPSAVVAALDEAMTAVERCAEQRYRGKLERIKASVDCLIVAGGALYPNPQHLENVANLALDLQSVVKQCRLPDGRPAELRIGIHVGPCTAGLVSRKRMLYDMWGEAVEVARRMEAAATPRTVTCSPAVEGRLRGRGFTFEAAGPAGARVFRLLRSEHLGDLLPLAHRPITSGSALLEPPHPAPTSRRPSSAPPDAADLAAAAAAAVEALAAEQAGHAMFPDSLDLSTVLDDPCLETWRIPPERHEEFVHAMLRALGLDVRFGITRPVLRPFLTAVRHLYGHAPFHSFQHALDVCHCMFVMIRLLCNRRRYLAPEDQLACLVAALCHDVGHPGTTNLYQSQSKSDAFLKYGPVSTLEKMHLHSALQLLELEGAEAAEDEDLAYGHEYDEAAAERPRDPFAAPASQQSRRERGLERGRRRAYSLELEAPPLADVDGPASSSPGGHESASGRDEDARARGTWRPERHGSLERQKRREATSPQPTPPREEPPQRAQVRDGRRASLAYVRGVPHAPAFTPGLGRTAESPPSSPPRAVSPAVASAPLEPALRALRPAALLDRMRPRQRARFRAMLRALVLATDVTRNASYIREYARSFPAGSPPEAAISKLGGGFSFQEARLLGEMMIKCADLSNAARGFDNAIYWSRRLRQEFLRQGRREKASGFKVSPGMDTKGSAFEQQLAWAEGQVVFFRIIVIPLYRTIAEGLPELDVYYSQVMSNYVRWQVTARWKRVCASVIAGLYAMRRVASSAATNAGIFPV